MNASKHGGKFKIKKKRSVLELANLAIDADENGKHELAIKYYSDTIEILLSQLKNTNNDSNEKQKLSKRIEDYMDRAEFLKQKNQTKTKTVKSKITQLTPVYQKPKPNEKNGNNRFLKGDGIKNKKAIEERNNYAMSILDEVLDNSPGVHWNDIAGLDLAKQTLQEAVILPTMRPDIFTGLRSPPKGVLLFGPPGTGKTLLAKAVATESKATFFTISASSLTSKWVGEGEKLVRTLFDMAKELQPSVIFIDEIDSLLSSRSSSEHDASRRIKNQFFVELDGINSSQEDRVLIMGATNLPDELDEAIIRRLEKRIYVPLPEEKVRDVLLHHLLNSQKNNLSNKNYQQLIEATKGYSGSDIKSLCKEASLVPIREIGMNIKNMKLEDVRGIQIQDFEIALNRIRPSVPLKTIERLEEWNSQFGVQS